MKARAFRSPWALGARFLTVLLAVAACGGCHAQPNASPTPLVQEQRIPLPGVSGRIDHLALDSSGKRLFVAELGAGAVETVDLTTGRVTGRIGGLSEPQGVAYLKGRDELVVATGGDGLARFYRAGDGAETGRIALGDDADDVRIEPTTGRVLVGYGAGGIAIIDPASRAVVRSFKLPAHPEGFQTAQGRLFVNLPLADRIAVLDAANGNALATWANTAGHFNFPMAVDPGAGLLAVVYRLPARLALFDLNSGKGLQDIGVCGDADDVWFDVARRRIYVSCGGGTVDVLIRTAGGYAQGTKVATGPGGRTSLYDPSLDRLFVAVPASGGRPAAILSFRPQ